MKITILAAVMLLVSLASFAQKLSPDRIIGTGQCEEYKTEIYKAGSTYSAKL